MAGRQQQQQKRSRRDFPDSETQPNDFAITYFVPGDDIDAHVLVHYVGTWIDGAAKIRTGKSPDNTRVGFNITSEYALNAVGFRDIVNDSRDWDNERKTNAYKRQPYPYAESDTADRRARHGPSKANVRRPEDNVEFPPVTQSREYNVSYPTNPPPATSPPAASYTTYRQPQQPPQHQHHQDQHQQQQQQQYQQQQPQPLPQQQYSNYSTGGYAQRGTTYVVYESLPPHSQAAESPYRDYSMPTGGGDEPPPSYEQGSGSSRQPPQPPRPSDPKPGQPSGGIFDDDKRSTQMMRGGKPRNRG